MTLPFKKVLLLYIMAKKTKKERQPNYEKKLAVKGSFLDLVKVAIKVDKQKKKSE